MSSKKKRSPRAFSSDDVKVSANEPEVMQTDELPIVVSPEEPNPPPAALTKSISRGFRWGSLLLAALLGLIGFSVSLWLTEYVNDLLARDDWIGWSTLALAGIAVFALVMIAARELFAILRLRRLGRIRADAEEALRQDDGKLASQAALQTKALYTRRRDMAWQLARLNEHQNDIMDASETLTLVERELLIPLDQNAHGLIAASAKRVSVITAVSPLALLDMAVVAAQNMKMLRSIATLYGARPGTVGLLRLARLVATHIVVTGGIAISDDLVQQLIGQRLMAKLSARLGEGLFNGALTARIGLAAIEVCRPLPFVAAQPPRLRTVLSELARQTTSKS